jgi:hypothetical protein
MRWGEWAPGYSHAEGKDGQGDTFVKLDGTTGQALIRDIDGYATNGRGDWDDDSHPMTRRGKHRAGANWMGAGGTSFPSLSRGVPVCDHVRLFALRGRGVSGAGSSPVRG